MKQAPLKARSEIFLLTPLSVRSRRCCDWANNSYPAALGLQLLKAVVSPPLVGQMLLVCLGVNRDGDIEWGILKIASGFGLWVVFM